MGGKRAVPCGSNHYLRVAKTECVRDASSTTRRKGHTRPCQRLQAAPFEAASAPNHDMHIRGRRGTLSKIDKNWAREGGKMEGQKDEKGGENRVSERASSQERQTARRLGRFLLLGLLWTDCYCSCFAVAVTVGSRWWIKDQGPSET